MTAIRLSGGRILPCCAAPPVPDPAEPPCANSADSRWQMAVDGVQFGFCSARCRARFLNHEDWGRQIAATVLAKQRST